MGTSGERVTWDESAKGTHSLNQGLGGGDLEKAESEPGPDTQPLLLHVSLPPPFQESQMTSGSFFPDLAPNNLIEI